MQKDLKTVSMQFFETIQILYQNKQITNSEKNEIVKLFKQSLLTENAKDVIEVLGHYKRNVDITFRDYVSDLITQLN